MSMKNSNDIWNRTSDLPICSTAQLPFVVFVKKKITVSKGTLVFYLVRKYSFVRFFIDTFDDGLRMSQICNTYILGLRRGYRAFYLGVENA